MPHDVRECFNADRDHEQSVLDLMRALDYESKAAGYSLEEYVQFLKRLHKEIGDHEEDIADQFGG